MRQVREGSGKFWFRECASGGGGRCSCSCGGSRSSSRTAATRATSSSATPWASSARPPLAAGGACPSPVRRPAAASPAGRRADPAPAPFSAALVQPAFRPRPGGHECSCDSDEPAWRAGAPSRAWRAASHAGWALGRGPSRGRPASRAGESSATRHRFALSAAPPNTQGVEQPCRLAAAAPRSAGALQRPGAGAAASARRQRAGAQTRGPYGIEAAQDPPQHRLHPPLHLQQHSPPPTQTDAPDGPRL